jgi:hypothetical protein
VSTFSRHYHKRFTSWLIDEAWFSRNTQFTVLLGQCRESKRRKDDHVPFGIMMEGMHVSKKPNMVRIWDDVDDVEFYKLVDHLG